MKSLGEVTATTNTEARKAFVQYSKAVKNLGATACEIRKRSESMRAQGQAYLKQWEQQLAEVKSPGIRNLAEQRKVKL